MTARRNPPELGAHLKAIGYMVRYRTPYYGEEGIWPSTGCKGWKRKRAEATGVYVGMRRLGISWWSPGTAEEDREVSIIRSVGGIRVYAIAISHQCIRYVLPRDVEVRL